MINIIKSQNNPKEESMDRLSVEINNCKKCDLWKTRNKPLVGDGPVNAKILIVGESPGYHEDLEGRAFVGEAGKVFDKLLNIAGLKRDEVYITNVLKCHPPRNHNPSRHEIDSCRRYLDRQIGIINPQTIITLGKFASKEVFDKFNINFTKISDLHGKLFNTGTLLGKVRIIPFYHPAVACYHEEMLSVLEQDFADLKEYLGDNEENK